MTLVMARLCYLYQVVRSELSCSFVLLVYSGVIHLLDFIATDNTIDMWDGAFCILLVKSSSPTLNVICDYGGILK